MKIFKFLEIAPLYLLFLSILPNVVLIVASLIIGVDAVSVPDGYEAQGIFFEDKKTGYLQSINWAFTFTVLFPLVVAGCAIIHQRASYILQRLPSNKMLWKDQARVESDELEAAWHARRDQIMSVMIWAILSVSAVLCIYEWYVSSFLPLFGESVGSEIEPDWSMAAAFDHKVRGGKFANTIFALFAFFLQFLLLSTAFIGCTLIGIFAQFLYDASTKGVDGHLILPNPSDEDSRRGFQLHSEFCQYAIGFAIVLFLIIYVSQLHNNFLRDANHQTMSTYLADRFTIGIMGVDGINCSALLSMSKAPLNYSSIAVSIGAAMLVLLGGTIVGYILRGAALNARDNALDIFSNDEATSLNQAERENAISNLRDMMVWPFGNQTTNIMLFLTFFPILTLLFDAVVMALLSALTVALITRLFKSVTFVGVGQN